MTFNRRTVSVLVTAGLLVLSTGGAAFAGDDPGNFAGDDPGKLEIAPKGAEISDQNTLTLGSKKPTSIQPQATNGAASAWLRGSQYWSITPPRGTTGSFGGEFASYASWSNLDTKVSFSSGTSGARWYGAVPYKLDKMSLTDKLWVSSLSGVGISLGTSGPGISTGFGGKQITMSSNNNPGWRIDHSFSGHTFTGPLLSVGQNASVSAAHSYATWNYVVN